MNNFYTPPIIPSLASAPGSPVNGMSYYDTTLGQYRLYANSAWVNPAAGGGGGGSSDLLSTLVNSPISVTGAGTGTISTLHVFSDSGSPANYTWNLPSPSGNSGKLIGIRISPGMTKIVTIDAGSGVIINGTTSASRTRKMWAKESAILLCDGSNWFVLAANINPMSCNMARSGSLSASSGSSYIPMDTTTSDPTGVMADPTTNYGIVIARTGTYLMIGTTSFSTSSSLNNCQSKLFINNNQVRNVTANALSSAFLSIECVHTMILSAGDIFTLGTYLSGSVTFYVSSPYENQISVLEMPAW